MCFNCSGAFVCVISCCWISLLLQARTGDISPFIYSCNLTRIESVYISCTCRGCVKLGESFLTQLILISLVDIVAVMETPIESVQSMIEQARVKEATELDLDGKLRDLSDVEINSILQSVGTLSNLQILSLNNQFASLPEAITSLSNSNIWLSTTTNSHHFLRYLAPSLTSSSCGSSTTNSPHFPSACTSVPNWRFYGQMIILCNTHHHISRALKISCNTFET